MVRWAPETYRIQQPGQACHSNLRIGVTRSLLQELTVNSCQPIGEGSAGAKYAPQHTCALHGSSFKLSRLETAEPSALGFALARAPAPSCLALPCASPPASLSKKLRSPDQAD